MGGKPGAVGREEVGKDEERRRTKKKVEATGIRRNEGASPNWSGSEAQDTFAQMGTTKPSDSDSTVGEESCARS